LEQTINSVPVKYMVVGHTIQKNGINAECNGKVSRIDVGMSNVFGGPVEILEIKNGKFRVLKLATVK
jgi:hypothetical protein